jgi:hypothetical protein
MADKPQNEHRMFMGIGDAILRLVHVERMYADGVDPGEVLVSERKMIVEALNQQYQLDLGFDCNMDGVPDTIEIFMQSAETSCCRILPMGEAPAPTAPKKRASSRKKIAPKVLDVGISVSPATSESPSENKPKKKRRGSRRKTK